MTNLLPGPSSSQLGIAIGAHRAGRLGGVAAWLGFTLPSAIAMTALALTVGAADLTEAGWVHGLELVAVPVVLLAVLSMARSLAPDLPRLVLAVAAAAVVLLVGGFAGQAAAIGLGAAIGAFAFLRPGTGDAPPRLPRRRRALAVASLAALVALLVGLPAVADATGRHDVELVDAMVRSGSLVFGGGHVVLPLLNEAIVEPGWVGEEEFLAGYGLVQAMPGTAVHVLGLSGGDPGAGAERRLGRDARARRDLPAVVPAARRRAARVVVLSPSHACAGRADGRLGRSRRAPRCRVVEPGADDGCRQRRRRRVCGRAPRRPQTASGLGSGAARGGGGCDRVLT